jgi:terminase large subunit-like protein
MDQKRLKTQVTTWRVGFDPLPSQAAFLDSEARFKGFSGPVGSGKSMALCFQAFQLATENPGCQGLLGAPTYRMMRDVTQVAFLRLLEENNIPHGFCKSENVVRIHEVDSEILLRSLDEPERLRGTNLAWFGLDELTFTTEEAWTRLEARLRDQRARRLCGFGVWTPNGQDWVYRRFIKTPVKGYECIKARPHENKHILEVNPDFYERLEHSYDPRFYRQEVLGEYLNITQGSVYECFDEARNVAEQTYDPRAPLFWSFDFNVTPLCCVVAQRYGSQVRVIDEIVLENATLSDAVEAFKNKFGSHAAGVTITGDASGRQRSVIGASSIYGELRNQVERGGIRNVTFRVPSHNPAVLDRVKLVNAQLLNSAGECRLVVDPRCKELVKDFEEVLFKPNEGVVDKAKDPKRTHISDALGYLIWELSGNRPTVGEINKPLF